MSRLGDAKHGQPMCQEPPGKRLGASRLLVWSTRYDNGGEESNQNGQRHRGSHRSTLPWLAADVTPEDLTGLSREGPGSGSPTVWVLIPALPFSGCVNLGQLFNLSEHGLSGVSIRMIIITLHKRVVNVQ